MQRQAYTESNSAAQRATQLASDKKVIGDMRNHGRSKEERCHAYLLRWKGSPELQAEFPTVSNYASYMEGVFTGSVRA